MNLSSRLDRLRDLRERIQQLEGVLSRNCDAPEATGLDALVPRPGTLAEWVTPSPGGGAFTAALHLAARLLRRSGVLVVVDPRQEFYPPAAAQVGVPLDRLLLVRPEKPGDVWWAWEQALRCPGVAMTLGCVERIPERVDHRLVLAAKTGGGLGVMIRPADCPASRAAVRLQISSQSSSAQSLGRRRLLVRWLRGRSNLREATLELELDHEPSVVPVVPELAHPA